MNARTRAQKRLQLNPPDYSKEKDQQSNEPNQPVLDPYACIASTVTLDDVKILKGDFPSTVIQTHMDRTLFLRYWFGTGVDTNLPYMNGQNVTAKQLTHFNYWNVKYGSKDWKEYFSYVTSPNWIYTFKKEGIYRIEGSFGVQNTNSSAAVVLHFSGRGGDGLETRQTYTVFRDTAVNTIESGTTAVSFVHYEVIFPNQTLTVRTLSESAGTKIGRCAFLTLTYLANDELVAA